jgi:penicillin-insensitive murein DD-endopeptidase
MTAERARMTPPASTVKTLTASVGRKGVNRPEDVLAVQQLLNIAKAAIKEDRDCGRATISAIEDYQRNWTSHPDGRVDPTGTTWHKLSEGKLKIVRHGYVLLPQISGHGYYPYSTADRQYGTPATVKTLLDVCRKFVKKFPNLKIGLGDMSFARGAVMSPHKTHRNGRNVDIRPLRTDGKQMPVAITDAEYSRERTKALVELLRSETNLKSILFNDAHIAGVAHWEGHDNHLHVSMKQ